MALSTSKFIHVENVDLINNTIGYYVPVLTETDSTIINVDGVDKTMDNTITFLKRSGGDPVVLYTYEESNIRYIIDVDGNPFIIDQSELVSYYEISNILINGVEWYVDVELQSDTNSTEFNSLMLFVTENVTNSLDIDSTIGYLVEEEGFKQNNGISFSDTIFNYGESYPYLVITLDSNTTYTTDQNYKFEFNIVRSDTESTVTNSEGEPIAISYISDLKEESIKEFTELFVYNALNDVWNYINKLSLGGSLFSSSSSLSYTTAGGGVNIYDGDTIVSGDGNPDYLSLYFNLNKFDEEYVSFKYADYDINTYTFINNHIGIVNKNEFNFSFDDTDINPYLSIYLKENDIANIYLSSMNNYNTSSPEYIGLNFEGVKSIQFLDYVNNKKLLLSSEYNSTYDHLNINVSSDITTRFTIDEGNFETVVVGTYGDGCLITETKMNSVYPKLDFTSGFDIENSDILLSGGVIINNIYAPEMTYISAGEGFGTTDNSNLRLFGKNIYMATPNGSFYIDGIKFECGSGNVTLNTSTGGNVNLSTYSVNSTIIDGDTVKVNDVLNLGNSNNVLYFTNSTNTFSGDELLFDSDLEVFFEGALTLIQTGNSAGSRPGGTIEMQYIGDYNNNYYSSYYAFYQAIDDNYELYDGETIVANELIIGAGLNGGSGSTNIDNYVINIDLDAIIRAPRIDISSEFNLEGYLNFIDNSDNTSSIIFYDNTKEKIHIMSDGIYLRYKDQDIDGYENITIKPDEIIFSGISTGTTTISRGSISISGQTSSTSIDSTTIYGRYIETDELTIAGCTLTYNSTTYVLTINDASNGKSATIQLV